MKKFIVLAVGLISFILLSASSCASDAKPKTDQLQQAQSEQIMAEAAKQVGMPAIVNFQEKKTVKWIYELCDQEQLICHAYLFNSLEGKVGQYLGRCMGYGVPYSTQFSNPEKEVFRAYQGGHGTMPQAEPNGLFKPEGLSATWLIMIDEKGELRPSYIEPEIMVFPYKLHI